MTTTTSGLTHRKVKVPTNWERGAFLFMRISGILLLMLAVGHVLIQHVLTTSTSLTLQVVADTWNSWGWKAYDMLLLVFAITHGFNGLRNVLEDYIHNRQRVKIVNTILLVFMLITIGWSAVAIAAFDPAAARAAAESLPK